jgi:hypothetical protein
MFALMMKNIRDIDNEHRLGSGLAILAFTNAIIQAMIGIRGKG